jgi:tRNA (cytidine32/uridine32-2'-O)-methyltransferase
VTDNLFPHVRIVLVETSHPGNIGAAARAMKNMGLTRLTLVKPKEFPSDQARFRAVSAADVLDTAVVVPDVATAVADCGLVIGTSARNRRIPWPLLTPRECGNRVVGEMGESCEVAVMFGREDRGLTNDELAQCHYHVNIPTGEAYSSLNLAMAVQVVSYEILQSLQHGERISVDGRDWDMPRAPAEDLEHFHAHLESVLIDVGFHAPDNPRQLLPRLRRLFARVRPDQMEINMLRGFLTAIERRLAR